MKKETLDRLRKINPLDEKGIPKNDGNCQWCTIEGARVLLEGIDPIEIPGYEDCGDPIEALVFPNYETTYMTDIDSFYDAIKKLNVGELIIVNIAQFDNNHAYLIYMDESGSFLIDADRQVFVKLEKEEDFLQNVKGWEGIDKINYLNGDINSNFKPEFNAEICILNKNEVSCTPLPEYGTSSNRYRF